MLPSNRKALIEDEHGGLSPKAPQSSHESTCRAVIAYAVLAKASKIAVHAGS